MKRVNSYLWPVLAVISLAGYLLISYGLDRSQFGVFIAAIALLFACYFGLMRHAGSIRNIEWLIGVAILFRVILIFALPTLSDDYYRFIWDGNLLVHGISPFAHTPQFYMQHGLPDFLSTDLFNHLNSQKYYTVYPPVSQYIYALGAGLFGTRLTGNVVVMKTVMIAAEAGTFVVMKKLLNYFNLPLKYLLIYALNPLIILNLSGNLHFEGVMIFFLLLAFYLFLKKRFWLGALSLTLAVNTKLIPLIILPYLVFSLGWKRSAQIISVLILGTLLLFIPFLSPSFIAHFGDSLGLYFHSFEYNASIYYIVRWVGFQVKGYNIIHAAAPVLSVISTLLILGVSWLYRDKSLKNLPVIYITILAIYYLFSTTVHPWYVASLVAFAPLAGLLFPVAWSAMLPLTYFTYISSAYKESLWLLALEYLVVFGVMGYDLYHRKEPVRQRIQRIFNSVFSL